MQSASRFALFDDTHGQPNWSQTGFPSRELDADCSGLAEVLRDMGYDCAGVRPRLLSDRLSHPCLLVVPPPTGYYNPARQTWQPLTSSLFTPAEVRDILRFVDGGGRLLAFAYRFGDSFTRTNLRDLFALLGCRLNNDAVIDVTQLREVHPLQLHFETSREVLPMSWSAEGVETVCWRPVATFSILPTATVRPLALSPGGRCISFDCEQRRISFQSWPIAVAGALGHGRFILLGGPHVFETGPFGLLGAADNRRFLQNILGWLLNDKGGGLETVALGSKPELAALHALLDEQWRDVGQVEATGRGEATVAFVERLLRETGVLKALAHAKWMP